MSHHTPLRPSLRTPVGRPSARRALAALVVATALAVTAGPAGAAPTTRQVPGGSDADAGPDDATGPDAGTDDATAPVDEADLPPLGALPDLAVELSDVALTGDEHDAATGLRDSIAVERLAAEDLETAKDAEIEDLAARDDELTEQVAASRRQADRWDDEVQRLDTEVRAVAVDSFVRSSTRDPGPLFEMDPDLHNREATAELTSGSLARRQVGELETARRHSRRHRTDETLGTAALEGVRTALSEARVVRDEARAEAERLAFDLLEAEAEVQGSRRMAEVVGADFPLVVLDAYWKAARTMRLVAPGCGIEWWALAGIGAIESRHGTYAGSEVRPDGSLTKAIIGIPLTGSGGTAAIGDSDGGLIDGDPTIDRAAGPMQFIPQTWLAYGVDGDQDGEVQIQNIYDAAASAARYLCGAAGTMTDAAGLERGYFAYNHSSAYVYDVLSKAVQYGTEVEIDGVLAPPAPPPPPPPPAPAVPDPEVPTDTTPDGQVPIDPPVPAPTTAPVTTPPVTIPPPTTTAPIVQAGG